MTRIPLLSTPTRLLGALLVAVGLLAGLGGVARPVAAAGDCSAAPAAAALDAEEGRLLTLLNAYRTSHNAPALQQSGTLRTAATWMSVDSAHRGLSPSNHVDTLGRDISSRLTDCGYTGFSGTWAYYENVCCNGINVDSAEAALTWWQNSPGHNENLLRPNLRYVGVSRECAGGQCYWTLDMGTHPSGVTEDVPAEVDNDPIDYGGCACPSTALPYGPDTCISGYVWREAFDGDHVCVTPATRAQTAADNAQAAARRVPGGGAYGPNTCISGYVWRVARPDDLVCVTPQTRAQAAFDNAQANARRVVPR